MQIEAIINDLCAEKGWSENLYSVQMLREKIAQMDEPITVSEDGLWLVPFYAANGRRMEFYWFRLQVFDQTEETVEERILASTGAKCIPDVEQWIIDLFERTHLDVIPPERAIPVQSLLRYLDELLSNQEIKEETLRVFGTYSPQNIMLAVY